MNKGIIYSLLILCTSKTLKSNITSIFAKNNLKGRCFTIKNLTIKEENIYSKDASILLDKLSDSLQTITGNDGRQSFDLSDMKKQNSLFVIARNERQAPVGCGAYRPLTEGIAEIKRMYASFPHTGIGSAILCYSVLSGETGKGNRL